MYRYALLDVLEVVDGDTVDCRISLGFGLTAALRFRLSGVDCPEVYGPDASEAGQEAARFTQEWLDTHSGIELISHKGARDTIGIGDGAFGRWLATIIADDGTSLNVALVGAGHAKEVES
ncbi:nuclease homologue [Haloechinothrix alba]|uniref:Nuclease homologue n=1 Tax=Haloechinothrix alba TaxID=664784 RepID=A0A238WD07_9PSEU|nr:thermonuclease family protein [Haloechinothrix alba]SNR44164.1 nuclease homologue [Haloechinothrix alba]